MTYGSRIFVAVFCIATLICGCSSLRTLPTKEAHQTASPEKAIYLPWREAGLTERQAVAHLLNRFTFGPKPGEVDSVVKQGMAAWLEEQLNGVPENPALLRTLDSMPSLQLTNRQILATYIRGNMIKKELLADTQFVATLNKDSVLSDSLGRESNYYKRVIHQYQLLHHYRNPGELNDELISQKLYRAVYSNNQLREVLTDFWFNHFNVSTTNYQSYPFVQTFERDAIRPHVLGRFLTLLEATAKHPAMLLYLNNAESVAEEGTDTYLSYHFHPIREKPNNLNKMGKPRNGLNENYARELMELHTMGVDGGYTQTDVTEVARAFTGWTVYPLMTNADKERERLDNILNNPVSKMGFVHDGDFLFRAGQHDARPKTILKHEFPAGGGVEEGEHVLEMLAQHPSTARFIAQKIAIRFVSDTPPETLVTRLSDTFIATDGDLKKVMLALVESPEFWQPEAIRAKIKSPFELAASSLRALDAQMDDSHEVTNWVRRMGQPLYACIPPTGYPDRATEWINSGALLNRMNFGLQLATGEIHGVRFDWEKLSAGPEPATLEAALQKFAVLLMPERDISETVRLLTPAIHDPQYTVKIRKSIVDDETKFASDTSVDSRKVNAERSSSLETVAGLLLGSPEFQRR